DEETLLDLLEGRLDAQAARAAGEHIDRCADCRLLAGGMAEAETKAQGGPPPDARPVLEPGARVGRYVVLDLVGRGAMGAVYAAYDPELDRKVAIKLLAVAAADEKLLAELQR